MVAPALRFAFAALGAAHVLAQPPYGPPTPAPFPPGFVVKYYDQPYDHFNLLTL